GCKRFYELHLSKQSAYNQYRRHAANLAIDIFPAPALAALDVQYLFSQLLARHEVLSFSKGRTSLLSQTSCHAEKAIPATAPQAAGVSLFLSGRQASPAI